MESITLNVSQREPGTRRELRRMRRDGAIPGICYGGGSAEIAVAVDRREFLQRLGRLEGTHLIRFASGVTTLDGKTVILKEVQVHPVTSEVLHADFYAIDLARPLRVHVPLHFEGKAAGVTAGGVLQPVHREVTVECLPDAIPEAIIVDVSALGIHDAIHVRDLTLPGNVQLIADSNYAVVTVLAPIVEAAPVVAVAEVAVEGAAAPGATPATPAPAPEKS